MTKKEIEKSKGTTIRVDKAFGKEAIEVAQAEHRSLSKQIQYWAEIGKVVTQNEDIPLEVRQKCLKVLDQYKKAHNAK